MTNCNTSHSEEAEYLDSIVFFLPTPTLLCKVDVENINNEVKLYYVIRALVRQLS